MTRPTTQPAFHRFLPIAIALALSGAGCASSEYAVRKEADQRLAARVGVELAAAPALAAAKVEAKSHWGVVALVGVAPDEESRREAGRLASAVPGVARVDNLILVVKGDSKAEGSAPATGALLMTRAD